MKKIKLALVFLLLIDLVGCSRSIKPTPLPKTPTIEIDLPEPVKLNSVRWVVITEDNYKEVIESSKNKNGVIFLIALKENDYKALSSNHIKILRYIREQKSVIAAYRKYYAKENNKNSK